MRITLDSRSRFLLVALVAVLALVPASAPAGVLDFEGLTTTVTGLPSIQSVAPGYGGFTWSSSFALINKNKNPGSGYEAGTIGSYSAFNSFENPVSMVSATAFNFTGAYLTAAWNSGLNIQVKGLRSGSVVYNTTIVTDPFGPNWFAFNYANIDTLEFMSFGGVDVGTSGSGTHFSMENFTFTDPVPEPATLLLLGGGLAGLALRRRRQG